MKESTEQRCEGLESKMKELNNVLLMVIDLDEYFDQFCRLLNKSMF